MPSSFTRMQSWFSGLSQQAIIAIVAVVTVLLVAVGGTVGVKIANKNKNTVSFTQHVGQNSPLRMTFPEEMNEASVEEKMEWPSEVKGDTKWEGDTFTVHPSAPLELGQTYVFHATTGTKRADGTPLTKELAFTFIVSGAPMLNASVPPKGTEDVPTDTHVTLVFDRAMIPLATLDDPKRMPEGWSASISPNVKGRWRWLSTYSVEWAPEEPLVPGTRYTVSVPPGIVAEGGEKTENDFTFTFDTQRPRVLAMTPLDQEVAGPASVVTLQFSQPMDLSSAGSMIKLENEKGANVPFVVSYGMKQEKGKTVTDEKAIVLKPRSSLAFNNRFVVTVPVGTKAKLGNLGTSEVWNQPFHTAAPFVVNGATWKDNGIHLFMNNPVSSGSLLANVKISPEPKYWKESVANAYQSYDGSMILYPNLEPSTTYTFEVGQNLTDQFGQRVQQGTSLKFTTDPITPVVDVKSPGTFGIFERAKPPLFPISAVNVSKLDVSVKQIAIENVLSVRSQQLLTWQPDVTFDMNGATTKTIPVNAKVNTAFRTELDLSKTLGTTMKPGLYAVVIQAPEEKDYEGKQVTHTQIVGITNMALTMKYSGDKVLVWATDMTTGEPVANALITLHALNGEAVASGKTNVEGLYEATVNFQKFVTPNQYGVEFYASAKKGDDLAFVGSAWSEGMQGWDFSLASETPNPSMSKNALLSYVYTERPLYAAGDTVYYKAVMRLRNRLSGAMTAAPAGTKVFVHISDAEGNEVENTTLTTSAFGTVNSSFVLSEDASLGYYSISLNLDPAAGTEEYDSGFATFQVQAYRKPEFLVEMTTKKDDYFDGETIEADVHAAYYFGAPMSNAKVNWRAQTTDYYFNRYTEGFYNFATEDAWCWYQCEREEEFFNEGEAQLDGAGRTTLKVPISLKEKAVSQVASIEADITDESNQVVSGRVDVPVHKSKVYVGIRAKEYVVEPGSDTHAELITLAPDGTPVKNQRVKVQLYSRVWNTVQKEGVDGDFYEENEPQDTFVSEKTVQTGADGKGEAAVTIPKGGQYVIVAITVDADGREMKSSTSVYAWSDVAMNWPHSNNNRIDVTSDKPSYKPGEKATLLVKSPFQGKGVKALVTVERENLIRTQVIDLESAAQPITVDITPDMIPNAYVSVVVVKPRVGETYDKDNMDTGVPAFRIGYVSLPVDSSSKEITVKILPSKTRTLPGEKLSVTVKTTDASGKPVSAEASLSMVDMSLLALTGFNEPDMISYFYYQRSLGVQTAAMLQYLVERFKPGSKGGGGGTDPETKQRGDFRDTAFWKADLVTNAQGEGTVTFTLPDNLTTWKLLAIAASKNNTFGASSAEVLTTKNVIVRAALPRFAVEGDTFTIQAIVRNDLEQQKSFAVKLAAEGLTVKGNATANITLKPGEQKSVPFTVVANPGAKATVTVSADTAGARDEVKQSFPVLVAGIPQTVATSDEVTDVKQEMISMPRADEIAEGEVKLTLSRSMLSWIRGGLDYVTTYPYGCAEQVVSSFFGNVVISDLPEFRELSGIDQDLLRQQVSVGLQKLYPLQRSDGGFGYFEGSKTSSPSLTAYIVYALRNTQKAKFQVDESVLSRAERYLQDSLRTADMNSPFNLALRTQILFTLAESGKADVNALTAIADKRKDLPIFAKAQLAIALKRSGNQNSAALAKKILDEVIATAKIDPRGVHFEEKNESYWDRLYSTEARTTAFVLFALARIEPEHALMQQVVRALVMLKENGHWDTTQSSIAAIISLKEIVLARNELKGSSKGTARLNGELLGEAVFTSADTLGQKDFVMPLEKFKLGADNLLQIQKQGDGRLYEDLTFTYRLKNPQEPRREEGMSVERVIEPLNPGVQGYKAGETYKVTLTVTSPQDRHNVAVSSPLPAGFELINTQFLTSQQLLASSEDLGESMEALSGQKEDDWYYWWYYQVFTHTELRDDEAFLFAEDLPAGVYHYTYLVRATTAGTFFERPAKAWAMYFPEVFGQTPSRSVTITE